MSPFFHGVSSSLDALLWFAAFQPVNIQWLILLLSSLTASIVSVIVPASYKQTKAPRAHHGIKLFNECLARHQMAYLTFFLTVAITAKFEPSMDWVRNLVGSFGVLLALCFYFYGVYAATHQDEKIARLHSCQGSDCTIHLPFLTTWRLWGVSFLFALFLSICGVLLALAVR